jgi:site-specific recombinase XerD
MNSKGEVPVQLRITINGKRLEMSSDRMVNPDLWIQGSNSVKGTKEEGRVLNTYLNNLETNVYKAINTLELSGKDVTLNALRSILKGDDQKSHTLINLFKYHNTRMKSLVGIDFAIGTYKRYLVTLGKVEAFLKEHFRKDDICIDDLDHAFITNFEFYLKTVDKVQNNTAMKYIKNLKKVVKIAVENEWLDRDPFTRFKCTYKDPNRGYLSAEKLEDLENKTFAIERLNLVREMFVFSCYTGLAYADMEKLTPADIKMGIDGERWITTYRQKTDTRSSIPLLPKAVEIINKYKDHPEANNKGALLPVISNQKLNSYLKEIATLCQIETNLTFHTARHTFATTITLSNGVPIETVSRMLGHTSIKTTQIYSKVVDTKVSNDMSMLKSVLNQEKPQIQRIATA